MTIDAKRVREIFLEAAELSDEVARAACLERACGDDTGLRARVEALLRSHDPEGSFLGTPAAVVPDPDHSNTEAFSLSGSAEAAASRTSGGGTVPAEDEALAFLAKSTRPDSLGRLGHYEVLQVLGRGGFGIVFRAFDDTLQRVVALKVMAPQLAATSPARKRFVREAQSSAKVRHENVVQVYEIAEQPLPYLAMEFIFGETLQQKLDRVGPLDVPETLRIGRQIAEGLAAAHATDLIHRDIKPGNVLLEGGQHKVKITDFGLARAADDASISQSGIIAGTPMYMAPEQAEGKTLDQRADLFSLGSVLYQMVAGRPPFRANSAVAVLKRVAEDKPRAIREIIPETPQWLCDIIAKLHAKDPDDRYQSAREVADVLADCEGQLKANAKLKDYSRIPRSKPQGSGRRKWVAAAVLLLLPVIALAVLEIAGVTHLFRGQPANSDPIDAEGWVQLFNGKDLSNWETLDKDQWSVKNSVLTGDGPSSLWSERHYRDFHLRASLRYNAGSLATIVYRWSQEGMCGEMSICSNAGAVGGVDKGKTYTVAAAKTRLTRANGWFELELLVRGKQVTVKINGTTTTDVAVERMPEEGQITLIAYKPGTYIEFRKLEIKELPAAGLGTESGTKDAKQAQQASAKQLGIPVETTNSIGMKLRLIPPGKFTMGSSKEEIDFWVKQNVDGGVKESLPTEAPQHEVEITRPFYMAQTEVTVEQFRQFVKAAGYKTQAEREGGAYHLWKMDAHTNWLNPGFEQTDNHPVVCVSWKDAVEFCNWLSQREAKKYRLPTEAEWEYSCRAGWKGRWSFGDNEDELFNYARIASNSQDHAWPVAGLKANAWGLHDMHGNAWELCQDVYDPNYYKASPSKDPSGPAAGDGHMIRGSSWENVPVVSRSACRLRIDPGRDRASSIGFRVVLVDPIKSGREPKPGPVAKQQPLPPTFKNSIGMEFVIVPKGKSWLGGGKDKLGDQEVEIPADFYLGKYEVTQEEWKKVMGENPSHFSRAGGGKDAVKDIIDADLKRFPVENISWNQSQIFVAKLNKLEKDAGWVYRLPTEVEWEYACRGGPMSDKLDSAFDYYFAKPTNMLLPEQANFKRDDGLNRPCKVGSYEPNRLGLFDMHGNVWEWCHETEKAADGTSEAIHRGGAWYHELGYLRAWVRYTLPLSGGNIYHGLRLARVPIGAHAPDISLDAKQAQQASAKQLGIAVETTNSIGMKLRLIPPGKFTMGSSQEEIDLWLKQNLAGWINERLPSEGPQHEVEITRAFYLGKTEVTIGQFRQFVKATGYKTQAERKGGAYRTFPNGEFKMDADTNWLNPGFEQTDDHPVVCVSWNDAVEFCNWLSKQEGKSYRLPTEVEWEYSCRAGSNGRWSFGDNEGESLNYARTGSNSQGHMWPVAGLKANAWGLHDMHGNAWEWCQDVYDADYYKTSPPKDPPGAAAGGEHVARGGDWEQPPVICRSAFRSHNDPDYRHYGFGFRVVLVVSPPAGVGTESGAKDKPSWPAIAPFTDADVQRIAALPAAEQVEEVRKELMRRNPSFDGMVGRQKIEGGVVTEFGIVTDKVTDIAPIRVFNALRAFDGHGTWTDKANGLLADLTPLNGMKVANLTYLDLAHTKVNDAGMVCFKDCKDLTELRLERTRVSDAGLAYFKDCKNLTWLNLAGTNVSDAGLALFKDCKGLLTLALWDTQVGNAGLAHFKTFKNLERLYLDRTQVGDVGLAQLKDMPLRELTIVETGVTDLTPLQGMPLEDIRLTPKNITKGLDVLRAMKSLKTIGIAADQSWPPAEFWGRYDKGEFK